MSDLPHEKWRLWEGGAKNQVLLFDRKLEDLTVWWAFELSDTLIGPEIKQGKIGFSPKALEGLRLFMTLFPEWGDGPYMSIIPRERRRRLKAIFGDNPLAVEPRGEEIPHDVYRRLMREKLLGGPAAIRGAGQTDLILVKIPRLLPAEHRNKLVADYLNLLYGNQERSSQTRFNGKSGPFHRRRHELELLGRFRLFHFHGFNVERTKRAAQQDQLGSAKPYYEAKRFVQGLIPKRWALFEQPLCLIKGIPFIRQ